MDFAVEILGDTPKEKWLNAIDLYCIVIGANINAVRSGLDEGSDSEQIGAVACERLDSAKEVLREFGDEMKRLVEGAC